MAGFWQNLGNPNNPNFNYLLNQAIRSGNNSQPLSQPTVLSYGNDIHAARAILAASIPPNPSTFHQQPTAARKTTSVITLPPSLAKAPRKQPQGTATATGTTRASDNSAPASGHSPGSGSGQGPVSTQTETCVPQIVAEVPAAANTSSSSSPLFRNPYTLVNKGARPNVNAAPSSAPSLGSNSNASGGEKDMDTTSPVFSTEICKGKPLPVTKIDETRAIVLDPLKPQQKLLTYSAQRILHDNEYWHKFVIIGGAKMEREKVLKRIVEACESALFLPVMYVEEGEDTSFYARNCGSAVEKLCRNYHLCLELDGSQFFIRVHLQCTPVQKLRVNALSVLRRVLEKRWKAEQRVLDLSNFWHDPELDSFMFCPLSVPTVLHYVLQTAINHPLNFSTLILSNNGIRQLRFETLVRASYLRSLDLSHNELLYQKDLQDLKELRSVTKLVLDGNPVCSEFKTSDAYIRFLKTLMPQLLSLDHVPLFSGAISVVKEQNFLCNKAGYHLVDQFLKHFFDRYDWNDRRCLDGMYHEDALFSLTCVHIPGQTSSDSNKLTWYTSYNRNLMKLCDYSKAEKLIYHKPSEILDLFCSLPASEHDPYSFCVDLMHYNEKAAVISVNGVFREHPTMPPDPDHMRAFRRVFTLCCVSQNEWQITNEQLHLSNPTSQQTEACFKIKRPPLEAPVAAWLIQDAQLLTEEEKDQMSSIMMQITTLNKKWATRFLEDSHWYVREALIAFVNQYESKTLPDEAFAPNCS